MLPHVSMLAPASPHLLRQCKQPLKQLNTLRLLAAPCSAKCSPLPHSSAEQTGLCGNLIWGWEGRYAAGSGMLDGSPPLLPRCLSREERRGEAFQYGGGIQGKASEGAHSLHPSVFTLNYGPPGIRKFSSI